MATQPQHYSIVFKLADGEHTALMTYTKRDDKRAMFWAKKKFTGKPGMELISVTATTLDEHESLVKKNLGDHPSRVPLDEHTGGEMNRVLSDPTIVEPQ